jgi:DNA-directed RNA polymerase specialized sigma24 family protein
MDLPEVEETPLDMQKINQIVDALPWYDKELFKIYTEGSHNYSTLAKETGIPRTSIGLTINRVKKHIKRNL